MEKETENIILTVNWYWEKESDFFKRSKTNYNINFKVYDNFEKFYDWRQKWFEIDDMNPAVSVPFATRMSIKYLSLEKYWLLDAEC